MKALSDIWNERKDFMKVLNENWDILTEENLKPLIVLNEKIIETIRKIHEDIHVTDAGFKSFHNLNN